MSLFKIRKLVTCRYWALGPSCPNISHNGVDMCEYAHWDTGTLASQYEQRGTCANWLEHRCYRGNNCYYEHRHTGVPGLYQGVLLLTGIDLEIADAAFGSGFNTLNQDALMSLIWSVKRVIVRNSGRHGTDHPPKDPVYPDRYRPCGIGDNTKRKRHVEITNSPPPFHHTAPLSFGRNRRKNQNRKNRRKRRLAANATAVDQVLGSARIHKTESKPIGNIAIRTLSLSHQGATQADPINLLSDSEDEKARNTANISAKRQKTSISMGRYKVETPTTSNEPASFAPLIKLVTENEAHSNFEIIAALNDVKGRLEAAKTSMVECQLTMRDMFNKNDTKLGEDIIFPVMESLSKEIFRAHDGARDGIAEVVRSVEWLKADGLKVKDEIS